MSAMYEDSGRVLVPPALQDAYQRQAEGKARALTCKTLEEAKAMGFEWEYTSAVCALMDAIYSVDLHRGKASESVGGYSVSFDTSKSEEQQLYDAARPYLLGTGLLYGGCGQC